MGELSDLEVYRRLTAAADELDALAGESASLVGETALKTAAMSVRGMATAVYEHSLAEGDGALDS
jgi:hypothetical protein